MKSEKIRSAFIDFFIKRDHQFIQSSPVVPIDDKTLLFTNAGMNQFKPVFLGDEKPSHQRAVNTQKCIRVSGKHNDLEVVGMDGFHHTFFEMLGNWSFGDYYKAEAIAWAWELFTEVWGLDKDRLWATVYKDDDEALKLWPDVTDISKDRVLKFGEKENFWEMGETGPCGPCSEIHYYVGDDLKNQTAKGINASDDYWELWNLVFIQSNRDSSGTLNDLSQKHVDTGAGLERIVSVMQNKQSNYETDLFSPIIGSIESLTGIKSKDNPSPFHVISDHIRMLCFSIADGAMPSNDGRGYVLRRILRRASRFGRMLDQKEPFIFELVDSVGDIMGDVFPEVVEKSAHIKKVIEAEESMFNDTLDRGLVHFDKCLKATSGEKVSGKDAFKLYDTYGFPLDLTMLMAREKGYAVDEKGFEKEMAAQKQKARAAGKFKADSDSLEWKNVSKGKDSAFLGYETLASESKVRRFAQSDDTLHLVLDKTPFYAESGGQIGDKGTIVGKGISLTVDDTVKDGNSHVHICSGEWDEAALNTKLSCSVEGPRRQKIRKNHTATHLLNAALKVVLGEHCQQAGSLVHPDYLRFDYTHFEKMTADQIREVETVINSEILKNTDCSISFKDFKQAKKEGAVAMFGEKYDDTVRVLTIGDFSIELCGGTHCDRTGDIGLFKITEETSLASGVRRIVALTGPGAVEWAQDQSKILTDLQAELKCSAEELPDRIAQLKQQRKDLEKRLKQKKGSPEFDASGIVKKGSNHNGSSVVITDVNADGMDELKSCGDAVLAEMKSGVGVMGSAEGEKPGIVVVVTKDLQEKGISANDLAKSIGSVMGGGGGGSARLATAGGKDKKLLKKALSESEAIITEALNTTEKK